MNHTGHGFGLWVSTILILLVGPLGCGGCQHASPSAAQQPNGGTTQQQSGGVPVVRVRLMNDVAQVKVAATVSPVLQTPSTPAAIVEFPPGGVPVSVTRDGGWQVGELTLGPGELTIEPAADGSVSIDGHAYRGRYRLVAQAGGKFDVINDVDVESYLKGVLAREMMPEFHIEAYKAQAIVARTYALYESRTATPGRPWDLLPDQRSQVYGGISAESVKSVTATDATRGVVVASGPPGQEKIFKAYFSSCCGGATQSCADAFGDPSIEALSDQYIGPRCDVGAGKYHAKFHWGPIVIRKDELTRRFRQFGRSRNRAEQNMQAIERIDIYRLNGSGRPVQFTVTDARGAHYLLNGEDLRIAVNTDGAEGTTLFSSYFNPVNEPTTIRFENGHGFGHGVGLCQWCAQAEAAQGVPHETIVVSAYKNSKLVRAY